MTDIATPPRALLGWTGFGVGAVALLLTLFVFWAGPFAPQQVASVTVGEMAADIARSAARAVAGQPQPAPVVQPWTMDDYINIGLGLLAGIAIVLGVAAFIRQEHGRAAASGIALGALAIGVQFFAFAIMMIIGALVLAAIIYALRDVLGGILGG
jgi:hypothetical protein